MPDLYVNPRLTIPEKELSTSAARSSGPGGQNVNKVNSKITLRWTPEQCKAIDPQWRQRFLARYRNRISREGELVLHSERYRDQSRNLADVRQKLVQMLLECQSTPKSRKATRPTLASKRRRLEQKRRQSQKKQGATKTDERRLRVASLPMSILLCEILAAILGDSWNDSTFDHVPVASNPQR